MADQIDIQQANIQTPPSSEKIVHGHEKICICRIYIIYHQIIPHAHDANSFVVTPSQVDPSADALVRWASSRKTCRLMIIMMMF